MFNNCSSLKELDLGSFDTSKVELMFRMFYNCSSLTKLNLSSFDTSKVGMMFSMFDGCSSLTELDLSSFDTSGNVNMDDAFNNCTGLQSLRTPKKNANNPELPFVMYDSAGKDYSKLPTLSQSIVLTKTKQKQDISRASIAGVSLSYGYSGKAYTPNMTVKVNGVTLTEGKDYTVRFSNNKNPGTATITLTGKGDYTGTRTKTFEIVDCVSSLVPGRTYQLIPKNNSKTAVSSYSGKMVNNTKVYITDRSSSEAMKFKAVKNTDETWKFVNAKCELALAVQQNSSNVGAGIVLYNQTTKKAQNWKLSKKSDNSWAIMNAVTGYSIDLMSKVLYCMSAFQAPYKAVLISLYEDAVRSDNERVKTQIKEVIDMSLDDMPERFRGLGLDDSLVMPSFVVNASYLREQIKKSEDSNPELKYHYENEMFLNNIMKEIQVITREK
ncbi:MAG: BspA family leucine-rich repeat surface protein [Lachnospiraceae bacterium]|nr:BspA family leucine-rich repeat surface protein [Lachnospiraceae bacterium]